MCLSGLISAGAGLLGSLFNGSNQKNAANKAAGAQYAAALQSLALQQAGLDKSLGLQQKGLDRSLKLTQQGMNAGRNILTSGLTQGRKDIAAGIQGFAPWYDAGKSALAQLQRENGLAPGGSNFTASPGYQFRFNEGQRGVQNSLAALGMKNSGAALKALDRYGQGIASDEYNNYYNRLAGLSDQGMNAATNMGNLRTNMANLSQNYLTGIANTVGGGYNNMAGIVGNNANNQSNLITNAATNMGNTLMDAGAARASGYVGGANALTGMVNNGVNQLSNYLGYKQFPSAPGGWIA